MFDNPKATDPSHSILAKDHVDLLLNEPAGIVAQIVVEHSVNLVVHVSASADRKYMSLARSYGTSRLGITGTTLTTLSTR